MRKLSTLVALAVVLVSCSNDNKTKEIAEDVCGCFEPVTGDLSAKTKKIIVKAFKSDNVQEVITEEVQKIDDKDEKAEVTEEITAIGNIGNNKKIEKCVKNLKKKYKVKDKDKRMAKAIADEMQDVSDCDVAAAMMKMASEQDSGEDEEALDEEETTEENEK